MIPTKLRSALAPLLGATLLAGCAAEYEGLLDLDDTPGGDLMARYVSLGNSITVGFQSGGLTDSLQMLAYPVLVAQQAGAPFEVPLVADPGCPPPFVQPVLIPNTPRLGGATGSTCLLRDESRLSTRPIQNVAYVGSYITGSIDLSVTANPPSADLFKTLLLGGRSQVDAMVDADPTFVSVWLGNNETLNAAVEGVATPGTALLAPQDQFEAALDSIVRAIENTDAQGAALIAPVNALRFAPRVQPGAFYFVARAAGLLPKPVGLSCAPGTPGAQYFVALDVVGDANVPTIECVEAARYVTSTAEAAAYTAAVTAYKNAVKARADARDWIYIDPDARFATDFADPAKARKCQGLATAPTLAQLQVAVLTTCPSTSAPFFGSWISLDATHPSSLAHRAFANALINDINAKHGRSIPVLTVQ